MPIIATPDHDAANTDHFSEADRMDQPAAAGVGMRRALSMREVEVIRLYASGLSIGKIAKVLAQSKASVHAQKTAAMDKLGFIQDVELFHYVWGTGLGCPVCVPVSRERAQGRRFAGYHRKASALLARLRYARMR